MIQSDQGVERPHEPARLDPDDLRNQLVRAFLRSGVRFDPAPAWRFFNAHNTEGLIERYRGEFSTLIELMAEWRFQQRALGWMLEGAVLDDALSLTQAELEQQAIKRVSGYVSQMRRKAARA